MSAAATVHPAALRANPFVDIAPFHRAIILTYFVLWQFMPTTVVLLRTQSSSSFVLGLTLLTEAMTLLLFAAPFLIRKIGPMPMGWLNPLALASILGVVGNFIRQPLHIVDPFLVWFGEPVRLQHRLLTYYDLESIQWVNLTAISMTMLGALVYFLVFWIIKLPQPTKREKTAEDLPEVPDIFFLAIFGMLFAGFLGLLVWSGGLAQHLAALSLGRFSMREQGIGPLLVMVDFMPILLIIWYLSKPAVFRNPLFWIFLVLSLVSQFLADGSRSATIIPVVILTAAWMYRNGLVPLRAAIVLLVAASFLLTTLGQVRSAQRDVNAETSGIFYSNLDFNEFVETSNRQLAGRTMVSGPIAIAARVPDERDYLYGRTYLGAVFFWVPRTFWPEKPRGVGAHVNAILFLDLKNADGFSGASYPAGAAAEAFWNFGWLGIILVFAAYAGYHRLLAERLLRSPSNWQHLIMLLIGVIIFESPNTDGFVPFIQIFVLAKVTFAAMDFFARRQLSPPVRSVPRQRLARQGSRL